MVEGGARGCGCWPWEGLVWADNPVCSAQCAEGSLIGKAGWCSYQGEVCLGEGVVGLCVNILSEWEWEEVGRAVH